MGDVAVLGVGAIGGVAAAHLCAAGRSVAMFSRSAHDGPVAVQTPSGPLTASGPILGAGRAVAAPSDRPFSWILLATKAHQTGDVGPWLQGMIGARTRVAVLQNGVEQRERVSPFVGNAQVLPVVVDCPAERPAPGYILQRGPFRLVVADDMLGEEFAGLLEGSPAIVERSADFVTALWRKLCLNASSGAVTALTGRGMGAFRQSTNAAWGRALAAEAILVARAEGAKLDPKLADELIAAFAATNPEQPTSILLDRLAGRPLEHDARNAVVVRIGARHGIPTPVSSAAATLLAALSDRLEERPAR
ncbi:MAG: 2-dehydropantoate 2-reductase [bacterium]|nr:2-dehydropantoate 2-reductase [bacterium]